MRIQDIKKIAVMGAGDMGHGIAEAALLAGYNVSMRDLNPECVQTGFNRIKKSLEKLVERRKITAGDRRTMLANLDAVVGLDRAVSDADVVIEAVPEILDLKHRVFRSVDRAAPPHAVLASNTSNMRITEMAAATQRADQVVGMHFFNPVVLMKLVEIVKGDKTSEATMQVAANLALRLKKIPIRVEKDTIGFIVNRVNAPNTILLGLMVENGWATPEEIDAKMKSVGMRMGPLELMDYVGLDVVYHSSLYFAERLSPEFAPPQWLKAKIDAGCLGKKTGKGIYDWSQGRPVINPSKAKADFDPTDLLAIQVNEATKLLEEKVVKNTAVIDQAIVYGTGAAGPFALARKIGCKQIADRCKALSKRYGIKTFDPTQTLQQGDIEIPNR